MMLQNYIDKMESEPLINELVNDVKDVVNKNYQSDTFKPLAVHGMDLDEVPIVNLGLRPNDILIWLSPSIPKIIEKIIQLLGINYHKWKTDDDVVPRVRGMFFEELTNIIAKSIFDQKDQRYLGPEEVEDLWFKMHNLHTQHDSDKHPLAGINYPDGVILSTDNKINLVLEYSTGTFNLYKSIQGIRIDLNKYPGRFDQGMKLIFLVPADSTIVRKNTKTIQKSNIPVAVICVPGITITTIDDAATIIVDWFSTQINLPLFSD